MEAYIGTKIVNAEPCAKATKDTAIGAKDSSVIIEEGYKVVYEDGYESWSPKEVFERCYRQITIEEIKAIYE